MGGFEQIAERRRDLVTPTVDSDLPEGVRAELLEEIRNYLPAFLRKDATEQHDPVGDVKELLQLEEGDLERVVSVHGCLEPAVIEFGERLEEGIRSPLTASARPAEVGQAVRGPVDWPATVARRSLEGGNSSRFVVRSARRAFDTPENRALAWLLEQLRVATRSADVGPADPEMAEPDAEASTWPLRISRLRAQVDRARQANWLQGIESEAPSRSTLRRLRASRLPFYRDHVAAAAESMMELHDPSDRVLAEVLCRRYFEPAQDWVVFEVCVALRLARELAKASGRPRKTRLMMGTGGAAFARYEYPDGAEVALTLQTWPGETGPSMLVEATRQHGLGAAPSRPDLFVVRTGPDPDLVILELKASYTPDYLRKGLAKLLGYLGERPEAWRRQPSGWLVAPPSRAFKESVPTEEGSLWLVSSDQVAQAVVERFASDA